MTDRAEHLLPSEHGHFEPDGRSYTLTDADAPMPWCNVISNGRYGLVISHNGGGFSFFDDAQHNVLTRWEMDLARDDRGKFLYLADLDSGQVWSAAPAPCRPAYERYRCTHGPGWTRFVTSLDGIEVEWTVGVAPGDPVEVWDVSVRNASARPRRLRLCSYVEWCCGVAPDAKREFHRLFFNTRFDASRRAAIAGKVMWDIPPKSERDHWNQAWPYLAAHAVHFPFAPGALLALGDKRAFLGRYGNPAAPRALLHPPTAPTGFGRFGDAVAALGGDLALAPGQSVQGHFVLSIAPSEGALLAQLDAFADPARARGVVGGADDAWRERLAPTHVRSALPDLDVLNNHWLPYQAVSGRLWGRTGYYQQSGAWGFRDQLQDSQVWLPLDPARCREQILLHATRQFSDGSVNHWWHGLADFGNRTACSDDYLWLAFVTANYIKETGDYRLLRAPVPFRDDPAPATIAEHCRRALDRLWARRSARGLPLIGSCDWNDGLSAMGIEGRGESVWLAWFGASILADWAHLEAHAGDAGASQGCLTRRAELLAAANAHAWDGQWYRYGTKDNGEWVGSAGSPEGKVHLNAQTWAILSDGAPDDRADEAWQTVKRRLLTPFGPLLLSPAYTVPDPAIGYVTRYAPGARENGGVYMHAATWALWAACKRRDAETALRIWRSISPPTRGRDSAAYWAEPYVLPGNVDGPLSDLPGRAGWTWYTGSAAWLNRVCLEWMLGVRPVFGGLQIDPCPPAELGQVRVKRTWRGRVVEVNFDAAGFRPGAAPRLRVDGSAFAGNVLPEALVSKAGREAHAPALSVEVSWEATGVVEAKGMGRQARRLPD